MQTLQTATWFAATDDPEWNRIVQLQLEGWIMNYPEYHGCTAFHTAAYYVPPAQRRSDTYRRLTENGQVMSLYAAPFVPGGYWKIQDDEEAGEEEFDEDAEEEEPEEDGPGVHTITLKTFEKITPAWVDMLKRRFPPRSVIGELLRDLGYNEDPDWDAEAGDVLLQLLLFDDVIYG